MPRMFPFLSSFEPFLVRVVYHSSSSFLSSSPFIRAGPFPTNSISFDPTIRLYSIRKEGCSPVIDVDDQRTTCERQCEPKKNERAECEMGGLPRLNCKPLVTEPRGRRVWI